MKLTENELQLPNPDPSDTNLTLRYNMTKISRAESRLHEIAFVTPSKGAELLSVLNEALRDLGNHLGDLSYRESVAKLQVKRRRAVVVLEVIPTKLAEKKLSANDTNREAIIDLDPEYAILCDVQAQLEAGFVFIREKLRSMESAINSVKKTLDMTAMLNTYTPNPNLVVGTPETRGTRDSYTDATETSSSLSTTRFAVGKVKY